MTPKKSQHNIYFTNLSAIIMYLSVIILLVESLHAFNISPHPNYVLREPGHLKSSMPKMRSSYFGFSLNLKKTR